MESAAPGNKNHLDGLAESLPAADAGAAHTPLRATAIGESLPKALRRTSGRADDWPGGEEGLAGAEMYESMYSHEANALLNRHSA
jgi:hypothetical protein